MFYSFKCHADQREEVDDCLLTIIITEHATFVGHSAFDKLRRP